MRRWVSVEVPPYRGRTVLADPHLLAHRGKQATAGFGEAGDAQTARQARKRVGAKPLCGEFSCRVPTAPTRDGRVKNAGRNPLRLPRRAPCRRRSGGRDENRTIGSAE